MTTKKRDYPSKTRAFTMPEEVYKIIQDLADREYEGNNSLAVRAIVKRWHEEKTARQNGGK